MVDKSEEVIIIHQFGNDKIEQVFRKILSVDDPKCRYSGFAPGMTVEDGIIYERDVAMKMRDGVTIYTDIYRPEGASNIPAIIGWSPYGKRAGYLGNPVPGVPAGTTSPGAKFEGPDPAYWCRYGYAVVNPDIRGSFKSEGNLASFCSQEGRDIYDFTEWLATQDWCSGKIALTGNSWLAIAQWYGAAEKPPHLAAIAPWEGFYDFYRDSLFPGGIPEIGFVGRGSERLCGIALIENMPAIMGKYPLMNGFWEDKRARVENIEIPAYVVASWTAGHSHGTLDGFRRIASKNKWLRVHNTQEWPDYYTLENLEDLRHFYDRFLKGIRNGYELVPRVRISVLDPGGTDQVNRPEKEFPLARTQYEKLYLDASKGTLSAKPAAREAMVSYDVKTGKAAFTIQFKEDTELTGYMKLHLWVETDGSDDMDLFVRVSKLDKQGNVLPAIILGNPWAGAPGYLRVSHRELDEAKSTPAEPYLTHRREQMLKPGEIVPVEIEIWAMSMLWHEGQQLVVNLEGHAPLVPGVMMSNYVTRNKGNHIIHTGGKYDSYLQVPKIPQ
jgi:predicted acyl esterase